MLTLRCAFGATYISLTSFFSFPLPSFISDPLLQAKQPGNVMAINPLVSAALQAAQWSANNGYGTSIPAPAPAAPYYHSDVAVHNYQQSTVAATNTSEAHSFMDHALNPQAQVQSQQQQHPEFVPPPIPTFMWPSHFETNGSAYVYQANSGFFRDAVTDFYYEPKSKLYYSAKLATYFEYDASLSPPFKPYVPVAVVVAAAAAAAAASPAATVSAGAPATTAAPAGATLEPIVPVVPLAVAAPAQSAPAAHPPLAVAPVKMKLGSAGAGGGFAGGAGKKALKDIAKWGSVQKQFAAEDEDDDDAAATHKDGALELGAKKGADTSKENSMTASSAAVTVLPAAAPAGSSAQMLATAQSFHQQVAAPPAPTASTAAITTTSPNQSSASMPAPGPPICVLCQRQFASFEMLGRHERESKLHAENLRKAAEATAATTGTVI
jgi:hypothetical protein